MDKSLLDRSIAGLSLFMLLVLSILFITLFYGEKTGMAVTADTFYEDFTSIDPPWSGSAEAFIAEYEQFLQKELDFAHITKDSHLSIPLQEIRFTEDSTRIWLRFRFDKHLTEDEFIPLLKVGDALIFVGSHSGNTAPGYEDIYLGPISKGDKILTATLYPYAGSLYTLVKEPEYDMQYWLDYDLHELYIVATATSSDSCQGKEHLLLIYVDDYDIPAFSWSSCDPPFDSSDDLKILPAGLGDFDIIDSQISSGIFIEGFISTSQDNKQRIELDSIVTATGPYIDLPGLLQSENQEKTILEDIDKNCRIWNRISQYGQSSVLDDSGHLSLQSGDLILDTDVSDTILDFKFLCSYQGTTKEKLSYVEIGNVQRLSLAVDGSVNMERNDLEELSYMINYSGSIDDVNVSIISRTGENILEASVVAGQKIRFRSHEKNGTEEFLLTIKEPFGAVKTAVVRVHVLPEDSPPRIYSPQPDDSQITIRQGQSAYFSALTSDDRTHPSNLIYRWYKDDVPTGTGKTYTLITTRTTPLQPISIKLAVTDNAGLSTTKTWTVNLENATRARNQTEQEKQSAVLGCNNNDIKEMGEECDGTDDSSCNGLACNNCVCEKPACIPDWHCANWSTCENNRMYRTCTDSNGCGFEESTPQVSRSCDTDEGSTPESYDLEREQEPEEEGDEEEQDAQEEKLIPSQKRPDESDSARKTADKIRRTPKPAKASVDIVSILLWILGILILIPILLISLKFRLPKEAHSPSHDHSKKLIEYLEWYKDKGMDANSAYSMLLRMGFSQSESYDAVKKIYYGQ